MKVLWAAALRSAWARAASSRRARRPSARPLLFEAPRQPRPRAHPCHHPLRAAEDERVERNRQQRPARIMPPPAATSRTWCRVPRG